MNDAKELPATKANQEERIADTLSRAAHQTGSPQGPCAPLELVNDLDDGVVHIGVAVIAVLRRL